jgi:hypothetical protein
MCVSAYRRTSSMICVPSANTAIRGNVYTLRATRDIPVLISLGFFSGVARAHPLTISANNDGTNSYRASEPRIDLYAHLHHRYTMMCDIHGSEANNDLVLYIVTSACTGHHPIRYIAHSDTPNCRIYREAEIG